MLGIRRGCRRRRHRQGEIPGNGSLWLELRVAARFNPTQPRVRTQVRRLTPPASQFFDGQILPLGSALHRAGIKRPTDTRMTSARDKIPGWESWFTHHR